MQLPFQVGQFILEREIGAGGMGVVYQGVDTTLDRPVAIKVLNPDLGRNPDLVRRFRAEAKAQANLNHPNIAVLHAFLEVNDSCLIVMELLEGDTFAELLAKRGRLPWQEAVNLTQQTLKGLGFAHSRSVVHRDIKPGNLMLTHSGIVKIMDFGIAKALRDATKAPASALMGTPHYMSPEQILGQPLDRRCDIYCLGVTLYQLLAGTLPFNEKSDFQVMTAHVNTPPPPLASIVPEVPQAVARCVERALEKNPDSRFQTAEEFDKALEAAKVPSPERETIRQTQKAEPPPAIHAQPPRPGEYRYEPKPEEPEEQTGSGKRRWLYAAAAVVALGIAAVIFWPKSDQSSEPGQDLAARETRTSDSPTTTYQPPVETTRQPASRTGSLPPTTPTSKSPTPETKPSSRPSSGPSSTASTTPTQQPPAPQPDSSRSSPTSSPTQQTSAPVQASLLLHPDAACIVSIDGTEVRRLQLGESAAVPVSQGEHLVQATNPNSGFHIEKRVTVGGPGQIIVDLALAAEESAAAENAAKQRASAVRRDWKRSSGALVAQLNIEGQRQPSGYAYITSNDGNSCELRVRFLEGFSSVVPGVTPGWHFHSKTAANIEEGVMSVAAIDAKNINIQANKVTVRVGNSAEVFSGNFVWIEDIVDANPLTMSASCQGGRHENGRKCTFRHDSYTELSFPVAGGLDRAQAIADQMKILAQACAAVP